MTHIIEYNQKIFCIRSFKVKGNISIWRKDYYSRCYKHSSKPSLHINYILSQSSGEFDPEGDPEL